MKTELGAQRLYNAIKTHNPTAVAMFLHSEAKGDFRYQAAFNSWKEAGCNPQVLDALFQGEPDLVRWGHKWFRRNKEIFTNEEFRFAQRALNSMCISTAGVRTDRLVQVRELIPVFKALTNGEHHLNRSDLADHLAIILNENPNLEWPRAMASLSRGLGMRLVCGDYKNFNQHVDIIQWFRDIHGWVTIGDFESYRMEKFLDEKKYPLFPLMMEVGTIKAYFNQSNHPYNVHANTLRRQHQQFHSLLEIAPWLEQKQASEEVVEDEE